MKKYHYDPEYKKKYYQAHKDNYKVGGKWYPGLVAYKNDPVHREKNRQQKRENYRSNVAVNLFKHARARAVRKHLDFTLTLEDIIIPEFCPYFGFKLVSGSYKDRKEGHAPTIDRIDPDKGYTKNNIEVISDLANRMKSNSNVEILLRFADAVIKRFAGKSTLS